MEEPIAITLLNDFVFCPASIYFHNMYQELDGMVFKDVPQIAGAHAHSSMDNNTYTSRKDVLQGIAVYSEKYGLIGKIDKFDTASGRLTESKKQIKQIFDGYVFQVYAQCFALQEMGYNVKKIVLHSIDDNKNYPIDLPQKNDLMRSKFEALIEEIRNFSLLGFGQTNQAKCESCIYSYACKWGCND
ncbi:MAG: type V CRISPR-associated protein Cas4 [Eggerthellaceae bacterium]|nr:type V CRISPR-associated protein Cas4 [Eggerthellaceae bacterium]